MIGSTTTDPLNLLQCQPTPGVDPNSLSQQCKVMQGNNDTCPATLDQSTVPT